MYWTGHRVFVWKGMARVKKAIVVGLILSGAIFTGAASCWDKPAGPAPDKIIEIEHPLRNGKRLQCVILAEGNGSSANSEWEAMSCNWEGIK
jgi:hypothetical protein